MLNNYIKYEKDQKKRSLYGITPTPTGPDSPLCHLNPLGPRGLTILYSSPPENCSLYAPWSYLHLIFQYLTIVAREKRNQNISC